VSKVEDISKSLIDHAFRKRHRLVLASVNGARRTPLPGGNLCEPVYRRDPV